MEPHALAAIRRAMGVTVANMATILGLSGPNASDRVREMERGAKPITGPMLRVLGYLTKALAIGESPLAGLLPQWLSCQGLHEQDRNKRYVMHTQWPRFIGWVASAQDMGAELQDTLNMASIPVLPLRHAGAHLVVLFVDEPPEDTVALLREAVRLADGVQGR